MEIVKAQALVSSATCDQFLDKVCVEVSIVPHLNNTPFIYSKISSARK